jgi:hypothetical protein
MERDFIADAASRGMNVGYTDLFNNRYMNPATCLNSPTDKHWTAACAAGVAAASLADMSAATIGERNAARNAVMKQRGGIISGFDFIYPVAYGVGRVGDPPYGFVASGIGPTQGRYYLGADGSRYVDRNGGNWVFETSGSNDLYLFKGYLQAQAIGGQGTASIVPGSSSVLGTNGSVFCATQCDSVGGMIGISTAGTGTGAAGFVATITLPGTFTRRPNVTWSSVNANTGAPLPVYGQTTFSSGTATVIINTQSGLPLGVVNSTFTYNITR